MTIIQLQDKFASELAQSIRSPWDSIHISFECCTVNGESFEKYKAKYYSSGTKTEFDPSGTMFDILLALHGVKPEQQSEQWTWLEFTMEDNGKYRFDYHYGMPPMVAEELKYD